MKKGVLEKKRKKLQELEKEIKEYRGEVITEILKTYKARSVKVEIESNYDDVNYYDSANFVEINGIEVPFYLSGTFDIDELLVEKNLFERFLFDASLTEDSLYLLISGLEDFSVETIKENLNCDNELKVYE